MFVCPIIYTWSDCNIHNYSRQQRHVTLVDCVFKLPRIITSFWPCCVQPTLVRPPSGCVRGEGASSTSPTYHAHTTGHIHKLNHVIMFSSQMKIMYCAVLLRFQVMHFSAVILWRFVIMVESAYTNQTVTTPGKCNGSFQLLLLNIPVPEPGAQGKDVWSSRWHLD